MNTSEKELRDDLRRARETVFSMLPKPMRMLLCVMNEEDGPSAEDAWVKSAVTEIMAVAKQQIRHDGPEPGGRVLCPLCGGSTQQSGVWGFQYPKGLRAHLLPHKGGRQCRVFRELMLWTNDRISSQRAKPRPT